MKIANRRKSNPQLNGGGGWGIFNALLGWQNSATYGSVIGYNAYWIVVIAGFVWMRISERRGGAGAAADGHSAKAASGAGGLESGLQRKESDRASSSEGGVSAAEEKGVGEKAREIGA
jgi:high-affinity iron transporter